MHPSVTRLARVRPMLRALTVAGAAVLCAVPARRVVAQQPTIRPGAEAQQQRNDMKRQLRMAMTYEEAYYSDSGAYTADLSTARFLDSAIVVRVHLRNRNGYTMVATRPELPAEDCRVSVGSGADEKLDGLIICGTAEANQKTIAVPTVRGDTATTASRTP